uniref:Signal recognition particle 14 kDa protein n=1 Tax=Panagrolaimus sp. JU765 TaxID=591449 RepID=A0AC34QLI2_9BILA
MTRLENDKFLEELKILFQKPKVGGSQAVSITMKHYDGRTKPIPSKPSDKSKIPDEKLCLFRAQCGSNKISTVVSSKEVTKFQSAYCQILLSGTDKLKKEKKKTGKKNESIA